MLDSAEILTGALFEMAARMRGARVLFPHGLLFDADLEITGANTGVRFLDVPATHRALVRIAKGAGTPGMMPDLLGLACRVLDTGDGERPFDLLLASAGERPLARQLLIPQVSFTSSFYSSVLPYLVSGRLMLFGARAAGDAEPIPASVKQLRAAVDLGPLKFSLFIGSRWSRWLPIATLTLWMPLLGKANAATCYDVVQNSLPDLRPVGLLQALRGPAYAGSRRGRRALAGGELHRPGPTRSP